MPVSYSRLRLLQQGKINPEKSHIEAIAKFFGLPSGYFYDEKVNQQLNEEIAILLAFRDKKIRYSICPRSFGGGGGPAMDAEAEEKAAATVKKLLLSMKCVKEYL
jgi:hypothetical protein